MYNTVKTESGVEVIAPIEVSKAIKAHQENRSNALVVSLIGRVNNQIAVRLKEINDSRGTKEIGAIIRFDTSPCDTKQVIEEVSRQLKAVGYAVKVCGDPGYDGPGYYGESSTWFEIYV